MVDLLHPDYLIPSLWMILIFMIGVILNIWAIYNDDDPGSDDYF